MGYYMQRVDDTEQRIKREAPQMRVERLDYGFRLLVYPPEGVDEGRLWTILQPFREENGQREVMVDDQTLGEMIERWNRSYGR